MCSYIRLSELLELGIIEAISSILDIYDPDLLCMLLESIDELLRFGVYLGKAESNPKNPIFLALRQNDGLKKIFALEEHNNEKVQNRAKELVEYWQLDLEDI